MRLSETLGWIATIFFTVCYIPQIIKTSKTKTVFLSICIVLYMKVKISNEKEKSVIKQQIYEKK